MLLGPGSAPKPIAERQPQLLELFERFFGAPVVTPASERPRLTSCSPGVIGLDGSDEGLLERARSASNGAKFAQLWHGDTTGYPSQSEADLALCRLLAFYAGPDPARIDRIFRSSGLCRDKWIDRPDYRDNTIEKAVAGCTEFFATNGAGAGGDAPSGQPVPSVADRIGLTKAIADEILAEHHHAQDPDGKLYVFRGGVYRPRGEQHVKKLVKAVLLGWKRTKSWSSRRANEVVEYIRVDAPALWDRPPPDTLNLLNGLLDVKARILRPHDPQFLSPVQLGARFDPEATCPDWDQFVQEVFPADAVSLAWEIPACLMIPRLLQKRAVLLVGEGDNGKSVYLGAVIAFLGKGNVATVTLHKLEADRFAPARLVGRLANISPDLPSEHLKGTSVFKAITGGDAMEAERKFREPFEFEPFTRLLFSANHLPRSADASDAFFRRWTVVPFAYRFEPHEQIPRPELDATLSAPAELSGVLNRVLDALEGLLERRGYTESKSTAVAHDEFRKVTDPMAVWLEQNTVTTPTTLVPKDELFSAYRRHAEKAAHPLVTKKAFGQQILRQFPALDAKQRTVAGRLAWCWIGLGLAADAEEQAS